MPAAAPRITLAPRPPRPPAALQAHHQAQQLFGEQFAPESARPLLAVLRRLDAERLAGALAGVQVGRAPLPRRLLSVAPPGCSAHQACAALPACLVHPTHPPPGHHHPTRPVQALKEGQELPAEVVAALFEALTYDTLLQGELRGAAGPWPAEGCATERCSVQRCTTVPSLHEPASTVPPPRRRRGGRRAGGRAVHAVCTLRPCARRAGLRAVPGRLPPAGPPLRRRAPPGEGIVRERRRWLECGGHPPRAQQGTHTRLRRAPHFFFFFEDLDGSIFPLFHRRWLAWSRRGAPSRQLPSWT